MEVSELNEDIKIVFEKEYDDLSNNTYPCSVIITNDEEANFVYPNSDTLINIFSNIQNKKELKDGFIETLMENIASSEETDLLSFDPPIVAGSYGVSFYSLIKLGFVDKALYSLKQRKEDSWLIITILQIILKGDKNDYFTSKQLGELLSFIEGVEIQGEDYLKPLLRWKKTLITNIIGRRYTSLSKKIKGINLEINQDKKTVSEKISYLEFDAKYNELLNEIDKYINSDTSGVLNSGMISNLRVFMHDIIIDIADKISSSKDEEIPDTAKSKIGKARNYLKKELKLSDNDHKFINSFIDILHGEGGHSFLANKEYFRLARNIAIEIALLILSKYEKTTLVS